MIKYSYHTHTKRCGHAVGEDYEYVECALKKGITTIGFTDHIMLENKPQPEIRGNYELLNDYISSINSLKTKYKDKATIYLGFETDYFRDCKEYYKRLLNEEGFDYLILGQHFFFEDGKYQMYRRDYNFKGNIDYDLMEKYCEDVIDAMNSGLFSYFAHPDIYMSGSCNWGEIEQKICEKICLASLKNDIPLEINLGPTRWNQPKYMGQEFRRIYPYIPFWKMVSKFGCKVIIGPDVHDPNEFITSDYEYALEIIDFFNLNHVDTFTFKKG